MNRLSIPTFATTAALLAFAAAAPAPAQDSPRAKEDAVVIVDGVTREVYQSAGRDRAERLVPLEVTRSELGPGAANAKGLRFPAPGEMVYIHVSQSNGDRNAIPREGSTIQAHLRPRAQGGWEGAGPGWFDVTSNAPAPPLDIPDIVAAPPKGDVLGNLGLEAEQLEAKGRLVLRITAVAPDSPAKAAGIEKGDIIIGANRRGFANLREFADILAKSGDSAELNVLDSRTNQQAGVQIALNQPSAPPAASSRTFGADVEPAQFASEPVLRVARIEPGGPAEKAGIEVGDILIEAGGIALADARTLQRAVDSADENLAVKVRDHRTGKEVEVVVPLGAPKESPSPPPSSSPAPSRGGLGVDAEAGTVDLLPVVKVTKVAPGSPAEKAGIEVGDAIVAVNDTVIFAPNLLDAAVKSAGSSFTLTVLDAKTGKRTPVKIEMGR